MVKCSQIIGDVISATMDKFDQPTKVKNRYEKLFENIVDGSDEKSDIVRLIEELELNDPDMDLETVNLIDRLESVD